jgi:hypothetical protein
MVALRELPQHHAIMFNDACLIVPRWMSSPRTMQVKTALEDLSSIGEVIVSLWAAAALGATTAAGG